MRCNSSKQDQDLVIIIDCPIGVGKERTLYVIVNSILLIYVQDDLESMSGKTLPDPDIDVHWVYTLPEGAVSAIRKAILNISVRRPVDIQEEAEYADEEGEFRCYVQYSRNNIRTVYPGEHQEAVFELVRTINDHIPLSYRIKSKAHG